MQFFMKAILAAGDGADDEEGLCSRCDGIGQRSVWRFVGKILLAGEEPDKCSPLVRDVVADRAAEGRIAGLQRVKDRALRDATLDVELYFAVDPRQRPQM